MCFDIICSRRDIITEENINQKVASFAQALDRFKEYYKTNKHHDTNGTRFCLSSRRKQLLQYGQTHRVNDTSVC
jgi:hypothetical protein